MRLKVGDNHCHLNPLNGMGVKAFAKRFKESGGWFIGLVNLLSWNYGVQVNSPEDYRRVYELTVDTAYVLRSKGLTVAVILGPHPAELARLIESGVKPVKAVKFLTEAYRLAAKYVETGKAQGLGEVGRPHWQVPQEIVEACNQVMGNVADIAKELNCVVHLHTERAGLLTVEDMANRFRGLRKTVLHHAEGVYAAQAEKLGLTPSVPAKESEITAAVTCRNVVIESDFLDDPKRPGAVVAPWSIGRLFSKLIAKGLISEDAANVMLVENLLKLYGIEIE
ncbi:MAG: TatD family hydrolase [Thermofilaceae archaeon]